MSGVSRMPKTKISTVGKGSKARFLITPNAALRGFPPLELLQSAYSFEDLLDFIDSAKSGDMA
jgi:hypothetical protein